MNELAMIMKIIGQRSCDAPCCALSEIAQIDMETAVLAGIEFDALELAVSDIAGAENLESARKVNPLGKVHQSLKIKNP